MYPESVHIPTSLQWPLASTVNWQYLGGGEWSVSAELIISNVGMRLFLGV